MRSLKIIVTIAFFGINFSGLSQHRQSGILILSTWRDHTSFDLFVPGAIDVTKSLKDNLSNLKDTAIRFGTYLDTLLKPSMLKCALKIANESKVKDSDKYFLVLAVEAEYDDEDFNELIPDEYYENEIIFYGRQVFKVYDNKKPFFKKLRVLNLPKN